MVCVIAGSREKSRVCARVDIVANLFVVDVKVSARDCVCPFSHHTAEACDFARVRARARVISARDGRYVCRSDIESFRSPCTAISTEGLQLEKDLAQLSAYLGQLSAQRRAGV